MDGIQAAAFTVADSRVSISACSALNGDLQLSEPIERDPFDRISLSENLQIGLAERFFPESPALVSCLQEFECARDQRLLLAWHLVERFQPRAQGLQLWPDLIDQYDSFAHGTTPVVPPRELRVVVVRRSTLNGDDRRDVGA